MSTPWRLGAFVAALLAIFAASFAVGAAVGPEPAAPSTTIEHQH